MRRNVPPITFPPWGTLHILPQTGVSLPTLNIQPPNGLLTLNLPLLADPRLIGVPVFIQAGVIHTNNPVDWRFTNLVADRIQ